MAYQHLLARTPLREMSHWVYRSTKPIDTHQTSTSLSNAVTARSFSDSKTIHHRQQPQPPSPKANQTPQNPSLSTPGVSLRTILKDIKGPTRWVLYGGLALAATAETTFWTKVIHAKFFAKEGDKDADEFLERFKEAIHGYRQRVLPNYRRYYSENLWGL